jgi:hypothetical protein
VGEDAILLSSEIVFWDDVAQAFVAQPSRQDSQITLTADNQTDLGFVTKAHGGEAMASDSSWSQSREVMPSEEAPAWLVGSDVADKQEGAWIVAKLRMEKLEALERAYAADTNCARIAEEKVIAQLRLGFLNCQLFVWHPGVAYPLIVWVCRRG